MKKVLGIAIVVLSLFAFYRAPWAQQPFYQGKTIKIIVGYKPGGGGGTYGVIVGKYLGKHIPGNPTVVVQYMPGAAGVIAANHIYHQARPYGVTIGLVLMSHLYPPFITKAEGVQYDLAKFKFIGNASTSNSILVMRSDGPYISLEAIKNAKQAPRMGHHSKGSGQHMFSLAVEEGLRVKFNSVFGYKGGSEIDLALERGELDGRVASLYTYHAQKPSWVKEGGFVKVLLQGGAPNEEGKLVRDPVAPGVPTIHEVFPNNRRVRQIVNFAEIGSLLGKPFFVPPGTPDDRVEILRSAFVKTLKDPAFLDEASKLKIDLTLIDGKQVEGLVRDALQVDPEILSFFQQLSKN